MKSKEKDSTNITRHIFEGNKENMSLFQPIEVKPTLGRDWILNGDNNHNFKVYKDAYDDSPTNSSIINAFVNYIYGEGLVNVSTISKVNILKYISESDVLLICQDYKIYGGYSVQVIWDSNDSDKKPLKIEYVPIYKLGVNYNQEDLEINGYWYSWDWTRRYTYRPQLYPNFTGRYKGNDLEILVVKRPHAEPFFPVPDYLSGIPWAQVEGQLANSGKNHFVNAMSALTVINYNNGRILDDEKAKREADRVREQYCGTEKTNGVIVSFNNDAEEATVVDQISPPELNQQNVFYSEEAERKLIVAHSAPPILFAGSNTGSGFSSNADEIEVATNSLYRRHINPMRSTILNGLSEIFNLIDTTIILDFKDFKEEKLEGKEESEIIEEKPKSLMQKIFK